jgi:Iron-containing redox enzyme
MQPAARHALRFPLNIEDEKERLVLSTDTERIVVDGVPPHATATLIERLNAGMAMEQLAGAVYLDQRHVSAILSVLHREGLTVEEEPDTYTGRQIAALLLRFYSDWNEALFSGSLWSSLANGTAAPRVIDGWLIEQYHFIRGANARLAYAAAHAGDERIRRIFAHHYVEEYDHHAFFAESLRRRHIDPEAVDRVGPLPTTSAVINMCRRAARLDCLCYAACSGLLESTGSDATRARAFYKAVAEHYDHDGSNFVDPLQKHSDLDEGFGHGSVMNDVFGPIKAISADRANQIIETVALFKETLQLWFADLERYYFINPPFDNRSLRRHYRAHVTAPGN